MTDASFDGWMRTAEQLGRLTATATPYDPGDPTLQAILDDTATREQRAEFLRVCIPHMQSQLGVLDYVLEHAREATP